MMHADDLIAHALSGTTSWPVGMDVSLVVERALYHGVTGLLMARAAHMIDWPEDFRSRLRAEAVTQTMWEIRHRTVLIPLLAALDKDGVKSVLLKGTALAYGLYPAPAQRSRGDTDLLVAPADLDRARAVLTAEGFFSDELMAEVGAALERQESWVFTSADGSRHEVDLHVDVFSSPALMPVLEGTTALECAIPLPALSPFARALPLPLALLQSCLHRAQHVVSPYFVGGQSHYGGDRLIWLMDIDQAMRAMTPSQCDTFLQAALKAGVGQICAAALHSASEILEAPFPTKLVLALEGGAVGPAARYLTKSRSLGRVIEDLRATRGMKGKLRHAILRLIPPPGVMRARYPDLATAALPRLYLRRIYGLLSQRKEDQT